MSALEQSFVDLCATHGLHTISVGYLATPNGEPFYSVSAQRWVGDSPHDAALKHGKTIAEALTAAINEIRRVTSLADEALPELAA